ncbi:MAG: PEP-CTERM sorting domain-containing protein, partial [Verrucomicrobiaceae bacterium]
FCPLIAASSLLFATQADAALLLAGFHDFDGTAPDNNFVATNYAGNWSGHVEETDGGSNDLTYGPALGLSPAPSSVNGTALALNPPGAGTSPVTVSLTNNTGSVIQLGYLLFDAATSSSNVDLNVSYQISPGPPNVNNVPENPYKDILDIDGIDSGESADYGDYYATLSSVFLGIGQTITFTFGNQKTEVAYLDNIAITSFGPLAGVPEPGSLLALGCLVGGGSFLRSRRRKG